VASGAAHTPLAAAATAADGLLDRKTWRREHAEQMAAADAARASLSGEERVEKDLTFIREVRRVLCEELSSYYDAAGNDDGGGYDDGGGPCDAYDAAAGAADTDGVDAANADDDDDDDMLPAAAAAAAVDAAATSVPAEAASSSSRASSPTSHTSRRLGRSPQVRVD